MDEFAVYSSYVHSCFTLIRSHSVVFSERTWLLTAATNRSTNSVFTSALAAAKCLKCSTDEKPKIIKTAKCSYSALVTHLKYHEVEQAKYHQLLQAGNTAQQPISAYVVNHIGTSRF